MLLTPLKPIIEKYELSPNKRLGQNFLLDYNLIDRIARCAGNIQDHIVLEIGPGPGGLTRTLLHNKAKHVIVIEKDPRCIKALKELEQNHNLTIIEADALNIDVTELIPPQSKIVANLPYNIGTQLLINWLPNITHFSQLTLMFQKEVAERICAKKSTKAYGRLSIMAQWKCHTELMFDIPPQAFFPPPKVTSTVINITPREQPAFPANSTSLETVCKITFGKRRKMLKSSLKDLTPNAESILHSANINPTRRPEELSVEEFCNLAQAWDQNK